MADEVLVAKQVLQVPFTYSAGPVASRFLISLRDDQKIMGIRCPKCGRVYVPPRGLCGPCYVATSEWVEVGPRGTLLNFTEVHYQEPIHPATPLVLGIIRLDGADTGLVHRVRPGKDGLRIGMRLEAVFARERRGHILDLECFEPVEE